jgi:glycosyltransferase involved in cell wall biosynthesis
MRILVLATSARGGAGKAALRSFEALVEGGHTASFLSSDLSINFVNSKRFQIAKFMRKMTRRAVTFIQRRFVQSSENLVTSLSINSIRSLYGNYYFGYDVIHIHAMYNFISMGEILRLRKTGKKVVVTLHDERFFTGGCHYSGNCRGYIGACLKCPEVHTGVKFLPGLALRLSRYRHRGMKEIIYIAPSKWLSLRSQKSSLMMNRKVHVLRNPIPGIFFSDSGQVSYRSDERIVIGFIAQDLQNKYKGFENLIKALDMLDQKTKNMLKLHVACEIGADNVKSSIALELFTPRDDFELIAFYKGLNFLVVPSLQENSPNVIVEAMSVGTRVIAADTGGISELMDYFNLPVYKPDSVEQLAQSILMEVKTPGTPINREYAREIFGYSAHLSKLINIYTENPSELNDIEA